MSDLDKRKEASENNEETELSECCVCESSGEETIYPVCDVKATNKKLVFV